jgi:predicted glycoside hydrolase/deacetylase ChbG (UPF0249 family)
MTVESELVLVADDFGLSEAVDEAILGLAGDRRLSGTGCIAAGPTLERNAPRLLALGSTIDIGLHFALTEFPLGPLPGLRTPDGRPPGLATVIGRGLTGRLDHGEISAEFGHQIDRFREVFGRDPDYVDGHQHVHLLPAARRAIWAAFDSGRLDPRRTWVRDCREPFGRVIARGVAVPKALFISALAIGLAGGAARRGVAVNAGFSGITDFGEAVPYAERFRSFLKRGAGASGRALIMCHPARPGIDHDPTDPIATSRFGEWAYFSSQAFRDDLGRAGVRLVRSPLPAG